ncbi:hypothetical protein NDU88_003069 [Pleurodeles waltl]|uniref:Uncharacterized protein n=1 Tax=Pleurodeles waltl TaxID=8319 RepID=A0AAV7M7R9_PLEWA|nr:hypothetical protein NDU88_003069 [Pleurodeles waltl]
MAHHTVQRNYRPGAVLRDSRYLNKNNFPILLTAKERSPQWMSKNIIPAKKALNEEDYLLKRNHLVKEQPDKGRKLRKEYKEYKGAVWLTKNSTR